MNAGGTGIPPTSLKHQKKEKKHVEEVNFHVNRMPNLSGSKSLSAHYKAVSEMLEETKKFHISHSKNPNENDAVISTLHQLVRTNLAMLQNVKLKHGM